jgi:hypothetical protein
MTYEPDTIWGRTVAGDGEVAAPRSGLSLTQRRLLKELAQPRTFTALAANDRLPPPKLEHELVRLAQLQLVAFQRPGSPQPRTAPGLHPPPPLPAPVTKPRTAQSVDVPLPPAVTKPPRSPQRWPILPWCFVAAALGFATVLLLAT